MMARNYRNNSLKQLKSLREEVSWGIVEERYYLIGRLYHLFSNWKGKLPNLLDVFRSEEIDWLLIKCQSPHYFEGRIIFEFILRTGYKDKLKFDDDGEPLICRTTALHHAFETTLVDNLFKIYGRYDVNYTNKSGFTHFHVACKHGCDQVVEKFLELGQDPNCVWPETGDSPLHLAMEFQNERVADLLMRNGANPNSTDNEGLTPLHIISKSRNQDMLKLYFKINDENNQLVHIDACNNLGDTPLHVALSSGSMEIVRLLLERGTDPNLANEEGSTPLHKICCRHDDSHEFAKIFFEVNDEKSQSVQVDARNKLGQTPLQLAVTNFQPLTADILLYRGADISCIVFPAEIKFAEGFEPRFDENWLNIKFRLVFGALAVVENLERRGYELARNDATKIVKFFAEHKLFDTPSNLKNIHGYNEEKFAKEAKTFMLSKNLSLYDVVQLRPEQGEKPLTCSDYFTSARRDIDFRGAFAKRVSEMMARKFFRRWALESLLELTRYELPILCCEKIIEKLMNQDLCHICLAATDQSS